MRTIEKTIFTYAELSDSAKERAANWLLSGYEFDAEYILEDAEKVADYLGIRINTRSVPLMEGGTRQKPLIHYSIGDYRAYVSFSGYFSLNDIQLEKISEYAPQDSILHDIADKLSVIKSKYQGEIGGIISTGWRGNTVNAEPELDFTDENEFLSDADCESIQDAIRDFAGWILSCLQREFEYTQSAEYIAETMESNGYEFDGYGNIV